jgi:ATP-dependent exoDNAse (exonuclease V) beta subunit
MSSKYLEGLNDEQMQAATSIDGAVRLIAGAGSGKTFTLTRRVANICETKGIHPSRVLSLTFTNKAAEEMRNRKLDPELKRKLRMRILGETIADTVLPLPVQLAYHAYQMVTLKEL